MRSKLELLTAALQAATLAEDRCFDDVVTVLQNQGVVKSARLKKDNRGSGATHFLRVDLGDAIISIDVFTNDKFFSVRRGYIICKEVTYWYRWNHDFSDFEFDGPSDDREALYRFLAEVVKGF